MKKHRPHSKHAPRSASAPSSREPAGKNGNLIFENHPTLLAFAVDQNPHAMAIVTTQGRVVYTNADFRRISGYPGHALEGMPLTELLPESSSLTPVVPLSKLLTPGGDWDGELQLLRKNGEKILTRSVVKRFETGDAAGDYFIVYFDDITDRRRTEELVEHMSFHDPLTDLPNRTFFNHQLELFLNQAREKNQKLAVVLLDLDRFKVINETLGHAVGDQLLQQVGQRLRAHLVEKGILARMGGDEFLILLPNLEKFQEASEEIKKVMELFRLPFPCNGQELHVDVSLGISLYPEDGQDPLMLLKNADAALFEAKKSGRNHFKFYTAKLNASSLKLLAMEMALRQALEKQQIMLYYQPQVSLSNGTITGFEALVRWNHPDFGMIMPDQFIALAEETGLIVSLGKWVLRSACQQNLAWIKNGYAGLRMCVNLSMRQFQEPELVETILEICHELGHDPSLLELEITESTLMKDVNITPMTLRWLSKKGVRIALDDFGTGYSSLTYLKRFPINSLKIDRAFIQDCLTNPDDAAIVNAIVAMSRSLNLEVIAEGVEKRDQMDYVRSLGCAAMQGNYFSRAVAAEEATRLLQEKCSLLFGDQLTPANKMPVEFPSSGNPR